MILQADSGFLGILIWLIIGGAVLISSTQKKQKKLNWTKGGSFSDSATGTAGGQPSESLTNLNPRPQQTDYSPFSHSHHLQSTLQENQQGQIQLHKQSKLTPQLKQQMEAKQAQYLVQIQNNQNQTTSSPSNLNQQDESKTKTYSISSSKIPLNLKLTLNDIVFWQILGPCPGIQYKNRSLPLQ